MNIDQMLEEARNQIDRMYAFELPEAVARGAIVVDIRPQAQRAIEGTPVSYTHLTLPTNREV